MSDYGHLQEIASTPRTTSLTTAAAVSDTELEVDSAGDFDEDGGTLQLNGAQLDYTAITWGATEEDPDIVTLAAPLVTAADVDDLISPVLGGVPAEDWYGIVDMGAGDPVPVPLTFAQRVQWPEGLYDPPARVQVSDDLQHLEDAPGRPAAVGGRIAAWNEDEWDAAGDDTDSPGILTYLPIPHSLMVFQRGTRLRNNEFTLVDRVVTPLAAEIPIMGTDWFSAYYDRDPAAEVVGQGVGTFDPEILLVGTNTTVGVQTSIALPAGTEEGDLIVLATVSFGANGSSDARLPNNSINGAGVLVAWGHEDGTGAAIPLSQSSAFGYVCSAVAVYRGVTVSDFDITQVAATPMVLPTFPDAFAAIGIVTMASGIVAGFLTADSTLAWNLDVDETATKAHVSINSWDNDPAVTSPAGSFAASGNISGGTQTTLLLEAYTP